MFPSPYGVSSILIRQYLYRESKKENQVSVFLWSIIHSYYSERVETICTELEFPSPYEVIFILTEFYGVNSTIQNQHVSVSLQSYIHSYS